MQIKISSSQGVFEEGSVKFSHKDFGLDCLVDGTIPPSSGNLSFV
jgi:hypothetical protein